MKFLTGDDTGIIKCVQVETCKIARLGAQRRGDAVERLCWAGPAEDRETYVAAAYASGAIESRDATTGQVVKTLTFAPSIRCLDTLGSGLLAVANDGTCAVARDWCSGGQQQTENGSACLAESDGKQDDEEEESLLQRFTLQAPVAHACLDPCGSQRLAFGGEENDVKIYDIENSKIAWQARNVKENFLCLRVPVRVSSLQWATELAPSRSLILCGTTDGKIRLYDASAQRRPFFELLIGHGAGAGSGGYTGTVDEMPRPVTCSSVACVQGGSWSLFIGNTVGVLREYDLRMLPGCKTAEIVPGRKSHLKIAERNLPFRRGYKGIMGSIRALDVHKSGEALAAVGLGRFAYVFETKRRRMSSKVFLKQKLCSVLMSGEDRKGSKGASDDDENEDSEDGEEKEKDEDEESLKEDHVQEGFSSDENAEGSHGEQDGEDAGPVPKSKRKKRRRKVSGGGEKSATCHDAEDNGDDVPLGPELQTRSSSAVGRKRKKKRLQK